MTASETDLSIGEAAAASGLSVDTLRYYERAGLVPNPPGRSTSGRRRYDETHLRWLRTLVMLRRTGMPIADIRRYADLARDRGTAGDRLALLIDHRDRVLAQLDETRAHLAAIEAKIDHYRRECA